MLETFIVLASVYCDTYLSSGARMNCSASTVAHRTLPRGTCLMINYKGIIAKAVVNDVGPCSSKECKRDTPHIFKRELDLSKGLATKLKFNGLGKVKFWKC